MPFYSLFFGGIGINRGFIEASEQLSEEAYKDNSEYLIEELERVEMLVRYELGNWRAGNEVDADLLGTYIADEEIDLMLAAPLYGGDTGAAPPIKSSKLSRLEDAIERKKSSATDRGVDLRLCRLAKLFEMSKFDIDALLISMAPELDLRFEKIYSYLQDDVTKRRPRVELIIRLLGITRGKAFEVRNRFSFNSPLIKHRLIRLTDTCPEGDIPLLSRAIKVDERIIRFLLGDDEIESAIAGFSSMVKPRISWDDLIMDEMDKLRLVNLASLKYSTAILVNFYGPSGNGKKIAAEAICNKLGKSMLIVELKALLSTGSPWENLIMVTREAMLQDACLCLDMSDLPLKEDDPGIYSILKHIDEFPGWIFVVGEEPLTNVEIKKHTFISLNFKLSSFEHRKTLWSKLLTNEKVSDNEITVLAGRFKLSGGQAKSAIGCAYGLSLLDGRSRITLDNLYCGCKAQTCGSLSAYARKISPRYSWDDIVLPEDTKEQLREIAGQIKHKEIVYSKWGFGNKLSMGKGLNILFSGPSGTGKTMAVEVIASETGLDIYKIDLSCVVSKYIGETEKNLRNIFKEAETCNAILFFDEADAIFGKRSEIKDSHDRYANAEVNYLLQRVEEYEGIIILASNFKKNIDEAFLRRINYALEFPAPDEECRKKIWKNTFPGETPLGEDIDYEFLGKFKITGGNVKNIVVSAAFLAASDDGEVRMEHLVKAAKREFQKMGKLCTQSEFGKYYEMIDN